MIEEPFLQNPNYIVQSIIIHKSKATLDQAIKFLIKHNFSHKKIDEKVSTWRFRQVSPAIARKRGFTNFRSHKLGNSGITLVLAYHDTYKGGDLSANELADLLKKSYDPNVDNVGDWMADKEISNKASQVYHNPKTGENVIVHRGTQDKADILNDIKYAFGYDPEFPMRKATQEKAKAKYGNNLTTIGHSLGSVAAERLAEPNSKVITLDKPTNFTDWINSFYKSSNPNQIDIRHKYDPISILTPFQKREGKLITIDEPDAKWYDVFENHKTSKLRKLVGLY